jgi:hypothetical protein
MNSSVHTHIRCLQRVVKRVQSIVYDFTSTTRVKSHWKQSEIRPELVQPTASCNMPTSPDMHHALLRSLRYPNAPL